MFAKPPGVSRAADSYPNNLISSIVHLSPAEDRNINTMGGRQTWFTVTRTTVISVFSASAGFATAETMLKWSTMENVFSFSTDLAGVAYTKQSGWFVSTACSG